MRREIVAAGVEEDGDARRDHGRSDIGGVAAVSGGDVLQAVLVEVTGDNGSDAYARSGKRAGRTAGKSAVSVVEKDAHHVAAVLSGDQVTMAVVVEIGLKNVIGNVRTAVGGR